jgi:hypothetical protein
MKTIIIIFIFFFSAPLLSLAQQIEFQKDLMEIERQFRSAPEIMLTQKYSFSLDSANALPFDSGVCNTRKYEENIISMFAGIELFTDGIYVVRLNNPDKYMWISKTISPDSSVNTVLYPDLLASFKKYDKRVTESGVVSWLLSDGSEEVNSVEVTYDVHTMRILSVLSELSAGHPSIRQMTNSKAHILPKMFISVDYRYAQAQKEKCPQISDYIHVKNDVITPNERFKDYQMKIIK